MDNTLLLLISFLYLFFGGDLLVKSSVSLALRMKVSTLVVGMTVVSFATSSPELFVSIQSVLSDIPEATDLTFGNVIGSNIANITLVLGLTAMVFPIKISRETSLINYPFMFIILILFGFFLYFSQEISKITGFIFVVLLSGFIWVLIKRSLQQKIELSETEQQEYMRSKNRLLYSSILDMILGVSFLYFGSKILVQGVGGFAEQFGWTTREISLILVAIGTSVPELATSLVAAFRKHSGLAVGNLIGSNIFNILAVLGVTSIITPIELSSINGLSFDFHPLFLSYFWMMATTFLLGVFIYFISNKKINRVEGLCLFAVYLLFIYFPK